MNKFKYFTQGINSILEGGCKNLSQGIEFIAIDDNVIHGDELPSSIESIVFSNIPAYAGTSFNPSHTHYHITVITKCKSTRRRYGPVGQREAV